MNRVDLANSPCCFVGFKTPQPDVSRFVITNRSKKRLEISLGFHFADAANLHGIDFCFWLEAREKFECGICENNVSGNAVFFGKFESDNLEGFEKRLVEFEFAQIEFGWFFPAGF